MLNPLNNRDPPERPWIGYLAAALGTAALTAAILPLRADINSTTVGFAFLLDVLFVAILWGSKPAFFASLLAVLSFNFFFLPPLHTFTIADPQNWIALTAFFITALAVGQLSARARRRAEEAETGRIEIRRLYEELREAFERASEAEALRRIEQFKAALLDAVTHDLRTPLTSIKASATLLLEDRDAPNPGEPLDALEQHALLTVISQEADRLDKFVECIVDLARIEAGEIKLRRNWAPIDEIIDAAVARAEPLLRTHRLRIELEKELPIIRADARAVAEVFYTLLDNATKYAPKGTCVTIHAESLGDEMLKISVEDEGPGIDPGMRQKVFEKFFRGSGSVPSPGRVEGIGMGLSIAKGIVQAHGGRIWIDDHQNGHGTRVSFTMPVGDEEQALEH